MPKPAVVLVGTGSIGQALKDTVAGSRPGQNWDGVDDADALRAVLTNHPNAILFTGHSHWELNSENTMFSGIANFPVCFNTASVGYTWSDRSQKTCVPVNGCEGYFLQAKEDGLLLVRGRDFDGGLWLPSAQFIVEPATHGWRPATAFGSPAATPRSARCRSRSASRST